MSVLVFEIGFEFFVVLKPLQGENHILFSKNTSQTWSCQYHYNLQWVDSSSLQLQPDGPVRSESTSDTALPSFSLLLPAEGYATQGKGNVPKNKWQYPSCVQVMVQCVLFLLSVCFRAFFSFFLSMIQCLYCVFTNLFWRSTLKLTF